MKETDWQEGCAGQGVAPGDECRDCIYQRNLFGYTLVDGVWVKK